MFYAVSDFSFLHLAPQQYVNVFSDITSFSLHYTDPKARKASICNRSKETHSKRQNPLSSTVRCVKLTCCQQAGHYAISRGACLAPCADLNPDSSGGFSKTVAFSLRPPHLQNAISVRTTKRPANVPRPNPAGIPDFLHAPSQSQLSCFSSYSTNQGDHRQYRITQLRKLPAFYVATVL
jgi:hypothetical protein